MRKTMKILHTFGAGGLIGGLLAYMVLLIQTTPDTPAAYAQLRSTIAMLSNYLLLPSLALTLVSGLLSMAVHRPFMDKGWVLLKAALGILMFKGVLTVIGAKADYAAALSGRIAEGESAADLLDRAVAYEWHTLFVVLAISVANIVLGVWRPSFARRQGSPAVAKTTPAAARGVLHTAASPVTAPDPAET